jgi:hypothetical protein
MDRRFFSQLLAFGAGMVSTTQIAAKDEAAGNANRADKAEANTPVSSAASSGLPVTVSDFVGQAAARLPRASFDYVTTGSEDEVTLRDNVEAFRRIRVLPPLLHGVNQTDLSTTVLGQEISMPVLLAPVAALRMLHPKGVLASARAATRAGTICAASSSALNSVEEIGRSSAGPK